MSKLPYPNDERHYRNQLLCERLQQQQQQQQHLHHYNRPRGTPEERDSANEDSVPPAIMQQRTTMARYPELVRRTQGRGRPRQDHPIYTLSHPGGDGIETDGDIDDTLSEFAGGWYTPRLRRSSRPSSMRASTMKKLNEWLDAYQQERGKGRSMTDLRLAGYGSSEEDENLRAPRDFLDAGKPNDLQQEGETLNKEPVETKPQESEPPEMQEVTAPQTPSKTSTNDAGYGWVGKLLSMLLHLAELLLPITLQMLTFLRNHTKTALLYLWGRFVQPFVADGSPARNDAMANKVVLLLVLPLIAVLGVAYGAICILYWLTRLLLIEPNRLQI
uniref:Uncharacterized protein n=2 Tax=Anopheles coluzzii TaxID=1518534 RepID=A0A6E8VET5_ANOCL